MRQFFYKLATDQIHNRWIIIVKIFLWVISLIYFCVVKMTRFLYEINILKQNKLIKPVISIGNITWGGVGKTPFVELMTRMIVEMKKKPVVLSRGYMGSKTGKILSDEVRMMKENQKDVEVVEGVKRFESAQQYLAKGALADVFVMDDGFQHWPLRRDLDIVLIDATNPWGNLNVIPRGILREPLSALKRADIFVLTKTNLARSNLVVVRSKLKILNAKALIIETLHEPTHLTDLKDNKIHDLFSLSGKRIASFCSIGDPVGFVETLTNLEIKVEKNFSYLDHHVYTLEDLDEINKFCLGHKIKTVVTTHKDAVKLTELLDRFDPEIKIFFLDINIVIVQGKEEFNDRIHTLLSR